MIVDTTAGDAELEQALSDLAAVEGVSRQEIIRRAVLQRHERTIYVERVDDSASRMTDKWGDVLDRLGTV